MAKLHENGIYSTIRIIQMRSVRSKRIHAEKNRRLFISIIFKMISSFNESFEQ